MKEYIKRGLRYILKGVPVKDIRVDVHYLAPSNSLKGRKIIVTGGGRGLGFAMAKKFVNEGAEVLIAGRNVDVLSVSAEKIGCKYLSLDIRAVDSFPLFIDEAKKILGSINCLVNNAGISLHEQGFLDVGTKQFDEQFNTNLKGTFFLTQLFIERTREIEYNAIRKILFITSETGITVDERPYGLTKAALNSLVQGLAYRYATDGYRINALAPGVTTSDMTGGKADGNLCNNGNITQRYYLPEEVAEIASFLLSEASNILNGQIIVCNEGKTINARWK